MMLRITLEHLPLLLTSLEGQVGVEDLTQAMAVNDEAISRSEKLVSLVDARYATAPFSAEARDHYAGWRQSRRSILAETTLAAVYVVGRKPVAKRQLLALEARASIPASRLYMESLSEAVTYCCQTLTANGLRSPSPQAVLEWCRQGGRPEDSQEVPGSL